MIFIADLFTLKQGLTQALCLQKRKKNVVYPNLKYFFDILLFFLYEFYKILFNKLNNALYFYYEGITYFYAIKNDLTYLF